MCIHGGVAAAISRFSAAAATTIIYVSRGDNNGVITLKSNVLTVRVLSSVFCRCRLHSVLVPSVLQVVQAQGEFEQPSEARVRRRTAIPVHGVRQTIHVETTLETSHGQRAQVVDGVDGGRRVCVS